MIDQVLARRPGWDIHVAGGAGRAAPVEAPDEYVAVVGRWLVRTATAHVARTVGSADPPPA
jgi:hypothetical protein